MQLHRGNTRRAVTIPPKSILRKKILQVLRGCHSESQFAGSWASGSGLLCVAPTQPSPVDCVSLQTVPKLWCVLPYLSPAKRTSTLSKRPPVDQGLTSSWDGELSHWALREGAAKQQRERSLGKLVGFLRPSAEANQVPRALESSCPPHTSTHCSRSLIRSPWHHSAVQPAPPFTFAPRFNFLIVFHLTSPPPGHSAEPGRQR